ncbi:MAG TPA: DUF2892 domain-containing protein [Gaiellaceae bacterium]
MSTNMGSIDRLVRAFVVAPAAIVVAVVVGAGSVAGIILFALAAVMLATSAVGFCPLYKLIGLDTRSLHRPRPEPR